MLLTLFCKSKVVNMVTDNPKYIMDMKEGVRLANAFCPSFDTINRQNNDSAIKLFLIL